MKRIFIYLSVAIAAIVTVQSCQHKSDAPQPATQGNDSTGTNNPNNPNPNPNPTPNPADTGICFERDILPVFISNCAKSGCHDAATAQDGYVFDSWANITKKKFTPGDPDDTELYEKITENDPGDIMPPPPNNPLTQEQISLIRRWIKEGGQNTTNCNTGCDTNKFAYAADIKPVIDKYCVGCHSGPSAPKGVMLDSYTGIQFQATQGRLLGAINHQPGYTAMPLGGNKLPDCEIRKIEKWAAAGAPNN